MGLSVNRMCIHTVINSLWTDACSRGIPNLAGTKSLDKLVVEMPLVFRGDLYCKYGNGEVTSLSMSMYDRV